VILGVTYAQFVGAMGVGILAGNGSPPLPDMQGRFDYSLSVGANSLSKSGPGQNGWLTLSALGHEPYFWNIVPSHAAGLSADGAAFVTTGLAKRYKLSAFEFTPYWGPTLYQSRLGNWSRRDAIQFRTGIDVSIRMTDDASMFMGMYHISNAGISSKSAGIDVTHLGFRMTW